VKSTSPKMKKVCLDILIKYHFLSVICINVVFAHAYKDNTDGKEQQRDSPPDYNPLGPLVRYNFKKIITRD
jgi:hypothetical protein